MILCGLLREACTVRQVELKCLDRIDGLRITGVAAVSAIGDSQLQLSEAPGLADRKCQNHRLS